MSLGSKPGPGAGASPDTPSTDVGTAEVFHVDSRVVACDGGDVSGHPRVWLRIAERQTFCPWCSRIFVLDGDGGDEH